jgi:hypothetical protein
MTARIHQLCSKRSQLPTCCARGVNQPEAEVTASFMEGDFSWKERLTVEEKGSLAGANINGRDCLRWGIVERVNKERVTLVVRRLTGEEGGGHEV